MPSRGGYRRRGAADQPKQAERGLSAEGRLPESVGRPEHQQIRPRVEAGADLAALRKVVAPARVH
jgi:hypothetical protein